MTEGTAFERAAKATNWRIRMLAGLALLGIGVLVALVVIQLLTDRERDRAVALQQHTFEVIMRANHLSGSIASAEAALGRYVVSGDRALGQQYQNQRERARAQLARLRQLIADNPDQKTRIAQLQAAFNARAKELDDTALYSTFKRHRDAWGAYYNVRDSAPRAQVERLLDQLVEYEQGLLRERTRAAGNLIGNSSLAAHILVAFGLLIVLGTVALGWFAIQSEGERAFSDAEAAFQRERSIELQHAVAEATEQLRAEAIERQQAEEQLRQIQKMEAVGQLTGGIAHDFNNMLAVVLGGLELAKRHLHTGGPDAQKHIESAMEGANRAAALTRRLLAFSRSEPLLPEAVEPGALIAGMSDLLDRTLGDTIRVRTFARPRGKAPSWTVWVDRHQLENALLNLAVNARDAMEGRGTLTVTAGQKILSDNEIGESPAGDYVTITVGDSGSGMTPDVLERVFEPFFTTKPVGKGTGLGLSQIFGFVRQSGGEIGIETAPGEGTRVTLYLPRYEGEVLPAPAEPSAPAIGAPSRTGALDILVVEDDPRVLAATMGALEELGHRPRACPDPLQAGPAVASMPSLDLIVSDVLMPGQTGPEMVAALGDRLNGVAVLFVTGFAGEADAEMFGGRSVLRKPFTMAALGRAVEEAVEAQRPAHAAE